MTLLETAPPSGAENSDPFIVSDYLDRRAAQEDFVMVEFGHGALPVAYQQGFEFRGHKAYIGIEGWLRDTGAEERAQMTFRRELLENDQNTSFISHDLGGKTLWTPNFPRTLPGYSGAYNPATLLPDEAAYEAFAANVTSDSIISFSRSRLQKFLSEIGRVTDPTGTVVLRETKTPENSRLDDDLVKSAGLLVKKVIHKHDSDEETWEMLESIYNGKPNEVSAPNSRYVILGKLTLNPTK